MQHHQRILIVDDHPTNVALLVDILGDDYPIATATSGEEALERALSFQPALILLDIMMPGIDGYETCRRMRATLTLRHSKIIMVSAKAMVAERLQGYEAGADDYITKPFDEDELLAKVSVYLRLKSVEEVEQLKADLLSLLNHETRTPLNGIIGPLEMLQTEGEVDPEERPVYLNIAYESAICLQRLFDRVIALSAMKSGAWNFHFITTDLRDVLQEAIGAVAADASARCIHLEQILPEAAMARLDWQQMLVAVTSMLDNAIRFSAPEGCVTVAIQCEPDGFRLVVADQGDGIAAAILPQIFEEFVTEDVAHHSEGHGLSLAIAHQIVLAHGGTIEVQSTKGMGTTFTIGLPTLAAATVSDVTK